LRGSPKPAGSKVVCGGGEAFGTDLACTGLRASWATEPSMSLRKSGASVVQYTLLVILAAVDHTAPNCSQLRLSVENTL